MTNPSKKEIWITLLITLSVIAIASPHAAIADPYSPVIDLEITPPIINADGETHEIMIIQLETGNGYPYIAPQDIIIHLTSSNLDIVLVESEVILLAGKSFTRAEFNTSYNSGISVVTASAAGFKTDESVIQVIKSDYDAQLMVYAVPDEMPAVRGVQGRAVIQILDLNGDPYNTLQDIDIVLSSSNHTVLTLKNSVTIQKGTNYVEVPFTINSVTPSEATIFAQAPNFEPGSGIVTTTSVTRKAYGLRLYFGPSVVQPDQETHEIVTVQLVDSEENPAKADSDTVVALTSSNLNIATVTQTLIIPAGRYHATASVKTRYVNGVTTIAASSPSLYPHQGLLTVQGALPKILEIYTVPNKIIADSSTSDIITVQVQDEEGYPIKADHDLPLFLSSSSSLVGDVPASATIPKGQSYTSVAFTSTSRIGETTIVVATQGLEPSETTVETLKLQMNVTLTTPKNLQVNQTFTAQVNVTSYGLPVQGAEVKWNALGGVVKSEVTETDEHGIATAQIVQTYDQMNLKAQVTKLGYMKESAQTNIKITTQTERQELTVSILGFKLNVFTILIVGALIIALGLGAYVYIKHRRNKRDETESLEIYP
ncbi:Ig-like domain-containing protein [Candidatus Bathyarchaeota archaeon]|nr:Ig-like domain-containing protein [Candidatus Bathyarchaeota archaeon]